MNVLKRARHAEHLFARLLSLAMLVAVALLTTAWRPARQVLEGSVVGQVTNGTSDAAVPDELVITLHAFSGMDGTDTFTTTVAEGGTFSFSDVAFEAGETLVARAVHEGVTYVSEFATLESDQQEVELPITIYETTEDPASVAIAQLHIFINRMGDQLQVGQYCLVSNTGERTYVGRPGPLSDQRATWSTVLPDGAGNISFEGGELGGRFVALEEGFADTRPVLPGTASVEASFTYDLAYSEGISLEQMLDVPVRAAVLVLPEGDLALQGSQLSPEETLNTQMGPAFSYTAGPLDADETLAFAVVPRAAPVSTARPAGWPQELVVGVAALAAGGVAIYWMWRPPTPGPIPAEIRAHVEDIASLDRDFEAGLIPETDYRQRRRLLKGRASDRLPGYPP